MCDLLVGLPEVVVLGLEDRLDGPVAVHIEQAGERPPCAACGALPLVKDRDVVELVDLPCFGRQSRLVWHSVRWMCPNPVCAVTSWTWTDPRIAAPRQAITDRAGPWVTVQVGKLGRAVAELAKELGCDWHTVNDAVMAYGRALVEDPDRIGDVSALGLDETLFCRRGKWRTQQWCTSIVDVSPDRDAQLLDVVAGQNATGPSAWLEARPQEWRGQIRWGVLDLSGPSQDLR